MNRVAKLETLKKHREDLKDLRDNVVNPTGMRHGAALCDAIDRLDGEIDIATYGCELNVHVLNLLPWNGAYIKTKELCARSTEPLHCIRQSLSSLRDKGFVESKLSVGWRRAI